jgi:integrase
VSVLAPLPPEDVNVVFVHMLTISRAVDLFLGDIERKSRSEDSRTSSSYRRLLNKFCDRMPVDCDVSDITTDDCRRFLDGYISKSPGYQVTIYATLNSFLEWLYRQQRLRKNPLDFVPRPRRMNPEDLDVVTVSDGDVAAMLGVAVTWTEKLAVAVPAYLGPRRSAIARLRRDDYDRARGLLRFHEKGGKTIWKPVPTELRALLDAAIDAGAVLAAPDDYLIPPERKTIKAVRDDRVIWRVVTRVAKRAGVKAHTHALRAAFATFYLENNPNDLKGLQELMGHSSLLVTQVYLRKMNKGRAMERVRDLSWATVVPSAIPQIADVRFKSSPVVGERGFEPLHAVNPHEHRDGTEPGAGRLH